jgi:hypothetical protein
MPSAAARRKVESQVHEVEEREVQVGEVIVPVRMNTPG